MTTATTILTTPTTTEAESLQVLNSEVAALCSNKFATCTFDHRNENVYYKSKCEAQIPLDLLLLLLLFVSICLCTSILIASN